MKKIIFLLSLCVSPVLHSETFTIPNGDVAALINAMNTANTNGESDIINLATNGTYVFTTIDNTVTGLPYGYYETEGPVALPVILDESVSGFDLIINLNGSVMQLSNTAPKMRLFKSSWDAAWQLNGGTVKDFESPANNPSQGHGGGGGAIVIGGRGIFTSESMTFDNCKSNSAEERAGGALSIGGNAIITLKNSTYKNNTSGPGYSHGGAITALLAKIYVENCIFENNTCPNSAGAAIYVDGCEGPTTSPGGIGEIINCTFTNNSSKNTGGALFLQGYNEDNWVLKNCQFTGNKSTTGQAGAIIHYGPSNNQFNVSGCTFENNESQSHGGAIVCSNGSNNFTNCTFYGNIAKDANCLGGALYNFGDANETWFSTIVNCTFANNIAGGYGGAWCITDSRGSVKNTIISNNQAYQQCGYPPSGCTGWNNANNCAGFLTDEGNNIEYPERPNRVANPSYDDPNDKACFSRPVVVGSNLMPVIDPLLEVPDFNGGPTKTMALLMGSPAIDAGSGCSPLDQREFSRVGNCDIGAYEYGAVLSVNDTELTDIGLVLYPNPSTGEFAIKIPHQYQFKSGKVEVFGLDGKFILTQDLNPDEENTIKLNEKGVYLLNTNIGNQVFTNKILIH